MHFFWIETYSHAKPKRNEHSQVIKRKQRSCFKSLIRLILYMHVLTFLFGATFKFICKALRLQWMFYAKTSPTCNLNVISKNSLMFCYTNKSRHGSLPNLILVDINMEEARLWNSQSYHSSRNLEIDCTILSLIWKSFLRYLDFQYVVCTQALVWIVTSILDYASYKLSVYINKS